MYRLMTFKEVVRIPPRLFGLKISEGALEILRDQYERTVDKNYGVIVSLHNAKIQSKGKVLHGDGAVFCDVEFDALVFTPEVNEVVEGEVTEIVEFGAFVRLGPIDGLVHVSQVANDFLTYDKKTASLVGRQSKKSLKKADLVKAKIATVSLKDTIPNSKIALTMRPEGLGKKGAKGKEKEARK
ncbi:MAG: DNA-directed RNA polymerase [Candidatus Micrarchaeota archaeon]